MYNRTLYKHINVLTYICTRTGSGAPIVLMVWLRVWQQFLKKVTPAVLNSDGFKQH